METHFDFVSPKTPEVNQITQPKSSTAASHLRPEKYSKPQKPESRALTKQKFSLRERPAVDGGCILIDGVWKWRKENGQDMPPPSFSQLLKQMAGLRCGYMQIPPPPLPPKQTWFFGSFFQPEARTFLWPQKKMTSPYTVYKHIWEAELCFSFLNNDSQFY